MYERSGCGQSPLRLTRVDTNTCQLVPPTVLLEARLRVKRCETSQLGKADSDVLGNDYRKR